MKSKLLVMLLLAVSSYSFGQNIGLRVNYVITNWEGLIYASDMQTETLKNISFGIYGHAPISPIIAFEPGLFITPKGIKMSDGPFSEPTTNKSLYLDVPILMKMYIGGGGFHVNAGPQVSYLLSNKMVTESGSETDTLDEMVRWDFSVIFGLAYDIPFGMNIGAQFDLGLPSMFLLLNDDNYYDWTEARNRVLRFSVGYTFH